MAGIELRSPSFSDHAMIPHRHAKDGENTSPSLDWSNVPEEAVELALLCEDPDAPGGTFTHWILTGLAPDLTGLQEGAVPDGAVEGTNGFGDLGYGGPQPPVGDGEHRYFFRLYALKEPLDFPEAGDVEQLRRLLDKNELASGTLVGTYEL